MKPELYFDISSEQSGGSLFRKLHNGQAFFIYQSSQYDEENGEVTVAEQRYTNFEAFWSDLTANPHWHFLHPLFVHPEVRPLVQAALLHVNWQAEGDARWQVSHQRQWTKVLTDPPSYYQPHEPSA